MFCREAKGLMMALYISSGVCKGSATFFSRTTRQFRIPFKCPFQLSPLVGELGCRELCIGQTHLFLTLPSLATSIPTSEPGTVPHPPLFCLSWVLAGMVVHKHFKYSLLTFFSKESYLASQLVGDMMPLPDPCRELVAPFCPSCLLHYVFHSKSHLPCILLP